MSLDTSLLFRSRPTYPKIFDKSGMLHVLGISTEHAETSCTSSVLVSVETLIIIVEFNEYTVTGIAYIAMQRSYLQQHF